MKRMTCLLLLLPALAFATGRDDYARQWPLTLQDGDAGAYRVTLDRDVYRSAISPTLRDVAVFNGDGQLVPAALFDPAQPLAQAARQIELPWFPLPPGEALPAQDIAVISERDAQGRVRRVETRMADAAQTPARAANAWLIDASAVREPIAALLLEWPQSDAAIDVAYRVDGSDDLRDWRTLQPHTQLLDLVRGGQRLQQRRIALDGNAKYLRLSPLRADAVLPLSGVRAEFVTAATASDWQWESLQGRVVEESGKTYYDFTIDGRFPFARADIDTAGNDANEWTLHSRDDADAQWITRAGPWVAFQVGSGRSAPQEFGSVVRDRHWRLSSRSPASGVPTLKLGYRPEVVVFLAQGKPPYALAAGSAHAVRADAPLPQLVDTIRAQRSRDWQPASATLGAMQTLAGENVLAPKHDWTSWLLWSLLVAGAIVVAGFAISLLHGSRDDSGAA
jgi:hypothetical protein